MWSGFRPDCQPCCQRPSSRVICWQRSPVQVYFYVYIPIGCTWYAESQYLYWMEPGSLRQKFFGRTPILSSWYYMCVTVHGLQIPLSNSIKIEFLALFLRPTKTRFKRPCDFLCPSLKRLVYWSLRGRTKPRSGNRWGRTGNTPRSIPRNSKYVSHSYFSIRLKLTPC